jgi:CRISPR/Cas system-associated endonuclease Cas1
LSTRGLFEKKLKHEVLANQIAGYLDMLPLADSVDAIRQIEGQASFRYWEAWEKVAVTFPKTDLPRVKDVNAS